MKLAVLGTGKIVQEALPVLAELGVPLCALLSTERSRERAQALAGRYGIGLCCSSYEQALESGADTVYAVSFAEGYDQWPWSVEREALAERFNVIVNRWSMGEN